MSAPNRFDADARKRMGDLYGEPSKTMPTREEYREQLRKWCELADRRHTPAEIEQIKADQSRRIGVMK